MPSDCQLPCARLLWGLWVTSARLVNRLYSKSSGFGILTTLSHQSHKSYQIAPKVKLSKLKFSRSNGDQWALKTQFHWRLSIETFNPKKHLESDDHLKIELFWTKILEFKCKMFRDWICLNLKCLRTGNFRAILIQFKCQRSWSCQDQQTVYWNFLIRMWKLNTLTFQKTSPRSIAKYRVFRQMKLILHIILLTSIEPICILKNLCNFQPVTTLHKAELLDQLRGMIELSKLESLLDYLRI